MPMPIPGPGRNSLYTEELAAEICERLANGEMLVDICRDAHMPAHYTVSDWASQDREGFSARYTRAREAGMDVISMRTKKTAKGLTEEQGGESSGDVLRDKLIIETDFRLLKVWDPKRYGDKQQVELSGTVGLADRLQSARDRAKDIKE